MIRIAVSGALGRMGRETIAQAAEDAQLTIVAGIDPGAPPAAGIGCPLLPSLDALDAPVDVVIDFSHPRALPSLLSYAESHGAALVLGTTGYSDDDRKMIDDAATKAAIFVSPNLSYGIAVLADLARQAARALGPGFDVEIVETHHRYKLDAPSGTALMLADAIASDSPVVLDRPARHEPRAAGEIGIVSLRGGTIAGRHTVTLLGDDETIEITHTAQSQKALAKGALRAAAFIKGKPAGRYSMRDLLAAQSS